ncbi:MAG: endonuclease [Labilithrix sp.]|nr:endonuclease [Labilithrix sp.]
MTLRRAFLSPAPPPPPSRRPSALLTRCAAVLAAFSIASACASVPDRGPAAAPTAPPTPTAGPTAAPPPPPAPDDDGDADEPAPAPPPTGPVTAGGNHGIRVFDEAKHELGRIYAQANQHIDLYCGCTFLGGAGHAMRVDLAACGYVAVKDHARAERIEWEHAVPASAFGHAFTEWRDGDPRCVDHHGKRFKGRKCARLASAEFARIEADLHNLFPVVGEVNALRSDLPMGVLGTASVPASALRASLHFGACQSAIEHGVFVPRAAVRGDLARAYKYMDASYPSLHLVDDAHRPLFDEWDRVDPPDAWEQERNRRIAARQGNPNGFIGN